MVNIQVNLGENMERRRWCDCFCGAIRCKSWQIHVVSINPTKAMLEFEKTGHSHGASPASLPRLILARINIRHVVLRSELGSSAKPVKVIYERAEATQSLPIRPRGKSNKNDNAKKEPADLHPYFTPRQHSLRECRRC